MPSRRTLAVVTAVLAVLVAAIVLLARPDGPTEGPEPLPMQRASSPTFGLEVIANGLEAPTWVGAAPGDAPGVLWVAERGGRLKRLAGDGFSERTVLLDLRRRVSSGAEQGLLSVAFVPDFAERREVVVSFTDPAGDSRIELWRLGAHAADARRVRTLLTLDQPFPNHNGGHVEFGPHHVLYAGFGDGGGAGDPSDSAQEPSRRLGKILALDLAAGQSAPWRPVATGLRNPWRFWYDPALGEMWIGDVGQDRTEEIDRIRLDASAPVSNLGWSIYEGHHPFRDREIRGTQELTWPVASYEHEAGRCSVTGGQIARSDAVPALRGRYLFGDFCTGELWTVEPGAGITAGDLRLEVPSAPQLAHIGTDAAGDLVIAALDGRIHRVVPAR
jgi:glucose/arabinose dehydrogenase